MERKIFQSDIFSQRSNFISEIVHIIAVFSLRPVGDKIGNAEIKHRRIV